MANEQDQSSRASVMQDGASNWGGKAGGSSSARVGIIEGDGCKVRARVEVDAVLKLRIETRSILGAVKHVARDSRRHGKRFAISCDNMLVSLWLRRREHLAHTVR